MEKVLLLDGKSIISLTGSGIVEKQFSNNFYNRFIDEEKLSSIENSKCRRTYWVAYFSFLLFCLVFGSLPTFVGYDFNYPFPTIMFCWNILFAFLAFVSMLKIFSLERRFGVFKKKEVSNYIKYTPYCFFSFDECFGYFHNQVYRIREWCI